MLIGVMETKTVAWECEWDIIDCTGSFVGMYLHIMYTLPRYCHPRRLARLLGEQHRSLCISQSGIVALAEAGLSLRFGFCVLSFLNSLRFFHETHTKK